MSDEFEGYRNERGEIPLLAVEVREALRISQKYHACVDRTLIGFSKCANRSK